MLFFSFDYVLMALRANFDPYSTLHKRELSYERLCMDKEINNTHITDTWQQSAENIKGMIIQVRGLQVLLDSDVAKLYGYEVKRINETASRNIKRFPEHFRFRLTHDEITQISKSQFATLSDSQERRSQIATASGRNTKYRPYAYTEQGIGMLSGLLKNETAVQVSINIMDVFVEMRRLINSSQDIFAKVAQIDGRLLEHDKKFDEVFNLLQQPKAVKQHVFYKGQFYDAYKLVVSLIKTAKTSITVIDNYLDSSILDMLENKSASVAVTLITANQQRLSKQHVLTFSAQHGQVQVISNKDFHDRFLIVDGKEVYVFGASFKDLGNKCFAVFKYEDCGELLVRVEGLGDF